MTRLFDASHVLKGKAKASHEREEVKRRAAEAEALLAETEELDEESRKLSEQLSKAGAAVETVRYREYRRPGSKWQIEHARVGDDYVYQMFPLKKPIYGWRDIVTMMAGALDSIFPRSIDLRYWPPTENAFRPFYTIRVEQVAKMPGWEDPVTKRALRALSEVNVWS